MAAIKLPDLPTDLTGLVSFGKLVVGTNSKSMYCNLNNKKIMISMPFLAYFAKVNVDKTTGKKSYSLQAPLRVADTEEEAKEPWPVAAGDSAETVTKKQLVAFMRALDEETLVHLTAASYDIRGKKQSREVMESGVNANLNIYQSKSGKNAGKWNVSFNADVGFYPNKDTGAIECSTKVRDSDNHDIELTEDNFASYFTDKKPRSLSIGMSKKPINIGVKISNKWVADSIRMGKAVSGKRADFPDFEEVADALPSLPPHEELDADDNADAFLTEPVEPAEPVAVKTTVTKKKAAK